MVIVVWLLTRLLVWLLAWLPALVWGWLKQNLLGDAGLTVGVASLVVTAWVASGIYRLQKRDNEEVRKKQEAIIAEMVILIIPEITGREVTPEVKTRVKRLAKGIIDQVIKMPTLRGGAALFDPKVVTNRNHEEDKK